MKIIFTKHANYRIRKRGFLKEEITRSIKYPDKTIKKHGLYYYQKKLEKGCVEIVCEKKEKNLKLITVYWI